MTTDPSPENLAATDDETFAQDMRDYLAFVSRKPDHVEHCAELAEQHHLDRMEDEGVARHELRLRVQIPNGDF